MMSYTDMKIFNPEKIIKWWCNLLRLSSCPRCSYFPSSPSPSCPSRTFFPGKLLILPLPLRLLRGTVIGGRWAENQFRSFPKISITKVLLGAKIYRIFQRPDGTSWTWETGVAGGGGFKRFATCGIIRVFPRVKWHAGKNAWKYTKQLPKIYSRKHVKIIMCQ